MPEVNAFRYRLLEQANKRAEDQRAAAFELFEEIDNFAGPLPTSVALKWMALAFKAAGYGTCEECEKPAPIFDDLLPRMPDEAPLLCGVCLEEAIDRMRYA